MQNYQNFDLVSKFQKNCAYLRGYCGKTEGGVWEGWNFGHLQFTLFTTKKSKIASFSVQPFMVKMGSKSENEIFCYFFQVLLKEFKQYSMN